MERRTLAVVVVTATASLAAACATSPLESGNDAGPVLASDASTNDVSKPSTHKDATADVGTNDDATVADGTVDVLDAGPPPPPAILYLHSPDTLYTFDPTTYALTRVAAFTTCTQSTTTEVIDLAIDSMNNAYVTTVDGVYALDTSTAACTLIQAGSYPNSLSFVPAGTVDPSVEALVGYFGSEYVRIDTTTGNLTDIGALSSGYASSGDIVSVKGGGSFLTVTGNGCGDCLLQVDPSTGDVIQSYGALPHVAVYGLGYWGGTLFGFDNGGDIFAIGGGAGDGGLVTVDIALDGGTPWYGAGSTTAAPVTAADGGVIPTE